MVDERVRRPRPRTVAATIVGEISVRRDDPVVPAELFEVDVKLFFTTLPARCSRTVERSAADAPRRRRFRRHDEERAVGRAAAEQRRHDGSAVAARTVDEHSEPLSAPVRVPIEHRLPQVDFLPTRRRDDLSEAGDFSLRVELLQQTRRMRIIV